MRSPRKGTTSHVRSRHVVCVSSKGYAASLEPRKIYAVIRDRVAERHGLVRIVDETGDDYLFPQSRFEPIELSPGLAQQLRRTA